MECSAKRRPSDLHNWNWAIERATNSRVKRDEKRHSFTGEPRTKSADWRNELKIKIEIIIIRSSIWDRVFTYQLACSMYIVISGFGCVLYTRYTWMQWQCWQGTRIHDKLSHTHTRAYIVTSVCELCGAADVASEAALKKKKKVATKNAIPNLSEPHRRSYAQCTCAFCSSMQSAGIVQTHALPANDQCTAA